MLFKEEADLKPHQSRYWLHPNITDPEQFREDVQAISDLSQQRPPWVAEGIHVHSSDGMTGIPTREDTHGATDDARGMSNERNLNTSGMEPQI